MGMTLSVARYKPLGILVAGVCLSVLALFGNNAWAVEYAYAPVAGTMTSPFGWRSDPLQGKQRFHSGIDIGAPHGTPVYTPQDGVVIFSGTHGGYGNVVVVQHAGDLFTLYGHNSYLMVKQGDRVGKGQMISLVGSTGRSTGPHLHFEVRQGNGYVNPLEYLNYLQGLGGYSVTSSETHSVGIAASAPNAHQARMVDAQANAVGVRPVSTRSRATAAAKPRQGRRVELILGDTTESVDF